MANLKNNVWPFQVDHVENWAYQNNLFTAEECDQIILLGKLACLEDAHVLDGESSVRDSKVSWMYPDGRNDWIFSKVSQAVLNLNSQYFKFDLYGLIEGFQFTQYDAPSGHYEVHKDSHPHGLIRKLSLSVQLSKPEEYVGGELQLMYGPQPIVTSKAQGHLTLFPSYTPHKVTSVTSGTRYSLVCWVTGPAFK